MPAVIMTSAAPVRSEYSPSWIWTTDESAAPYCRSVPTALARFRSRFTTTISRAMPRRMLDNRQAEPTAPAPITPIFIWSVPPGQAFASPRLPRQATMNGCHERKSHSSSFTLVGLAGREHGLGIHEREIATQAERWTRGIAVHDGRTKGQTTRQQQRRLAPAR